MSNLFRNLAARGGLSFAHLSRGARSEDRPGNDDDSGKGKKGKRADDDDDADAEEDDDDEEEMRGKSAAARARRRERARCAAIFACKGAGRDPELAAELAFETTMTRKEAIAVLSKTRGGATGQRIRGNPQLGTGAPPSMTSEQAVAASWDAAFQKAGARPRRGR